MTTLELTLLLSAIGVVVLGLLGYAFWRSAKERRRRLQQQFGGEYRHLVAETGSERQADKLLMGRIKRVRRFPIRALEQHARRHYQERWYAIQQRFVDAPAGAVREAHELVIHLLTALGYPEDTIDQRIEDVSVHHPHLTEHFRAASAVARNARGSEASTEALRQAVIHYRALFDDLLEEPTRDPREDVRRAEEAHALRP